MSVTNDDNIVAKINAAGETIFQNIYKSMQNEIKDEIITKLLHKIEVITKELELLRKENTNIKNHLTYILKRILLNKSYYNRSSINNDNQSNFLGYKTKTCNDIFIQPKYNAYLYMASPQSNFLDNSFDYDTKLNCNTDRNKSIDNKVTGKLNSIYRNNFLKCSKGISNDFILNKNETIYDELFPTNKRFIPTTTKNSTDKERKNNNKKNVNYSYMANNKIINKISCMTCKLNKILNCRTHNNSKSKIINVKRKSKIMNKKGDSKLSSTIYNDPLDYYNKNSLTVENEENISQRKHASFLRSENLIPYKKKPKKIYICNTKSPFLINKI